MHALSLFVSPSQLLHLRLRERAGVFVDDGDLTVSQMVTEKMNDDELVLNTLDNALRLLSCHISSCSGWNRVRSEAGCRARKLYTRLLADRHEFLNQHFYAKASTIRKGILDGFRVVVCTTSRLQKLMSKPSSLWPFFMIKMLVHRRN